MMVMFGLGSLMYLMYKKYLASSGIAVLGQLSMQDWLFIISIVISVCGMVQEYLKGKKVGTVESA